MDLVRVSKRLLRFPAMPSTAAVTSSDELQVTNQTGVDLAFKMKTTNQSRYVVRPNVGVIPASQTLDILIGLHEAPDQSPGPSSEPLVPGPSKDKFLLCVAKAPGTAVTGLPEDYWAKREKEPDVQGFKFKVEFVQHVEQEPSDQLATPTAPPRQRDMPHVPAPTQTTPPGNIVASPVVIDTPASTTPSTSAPPAPSASTIPTISDAREAVQPISPLDADTLLDDRNYELALARVRELQASLDEKNLELSRLRTQLAETRAETERVLKEAPKTPLPANKILADPFGGVSIAGFGLMLLLFLVLVNVILRIV